MDQYPIQNGLPSQKGNSGKFLETDGATPLWSVVPLASAQSYITENTEQSSLPNSRQITQGPNINLIDDGVHLMITSTGGGSNFTILPVASGGTGLGFAGNANQVLGVSATGTTLEYKTISPGSGITITPTAGNILISALSSSILQGTGISVSQGNNSFTISNTGVTSVGVALPSSIFNVSGSPVTTTGTLIGTLVNQACSTFFAGPTSGSSSAPTFRTLVSTDTPLMLPLTGGTLSGALNMGSHQINNVTDPTNAQDAETLNHFQANAVQMPSPWTLGCLAKTSVTDLTAEYYQGDGHWVLKGPGTQYGGTNEYTTYLTQSISGNFTLIARLVGLFRPDNVVGAVFLLRGFQTDTVISEVGYHALVYYGTYPTAITVEKLYRTTQGSGWTGSVTATGKSQPLYIKIVRSSNSWSTYYSSDGSSYTQVGTGDSLALTDPIRVGFAVSTNDSATNPNAMIPVTAVFDHVSLTQP